MSRAKRYGLPLAGAALGGAVGGPLGAIAGYAVGGYKRPLPQALLRMARTPSVQTQLWSAVERAGQAGSGPGAELLMSRGVPAAVTAGEVAPADEDAMGRAVALYLQAQEEDQGRRLAEALRARQGRVRQ